MTIIMTRILIGLALGGLLTLSIVTDLIAGTSCFQDAAGIIKPPEDALTLSRFNKDGQVHTVAVLEDDGESIRGVDISVELKRYDRNSFDVIQNLTFDDVVKLIHTSANKVVIKYEDLLPGVAGDTHLAIGINYAGHGKETGQVRPFMFPKHVDTDPAVHQLNYTKGWLLDHEVELGIVFPSAVCSPADLDRIMIGFLVVNDFTDRATLMRKMDSKNVTGGRGFPDAKSKKGFLPTGPYMVIPRNWRAFVKELHLALSVNGQLRQAGNAKDMVWNIDKIIERSLAVKGETKSFYQDKNVKLFEGNCIPANSIIITGTPSGVVFNAPKKRFIFGTVTKYIFTGGFFSEKMHPYILQQYLKKEMKNQRYLKPGDYVETSISFLGTIKTSIKE
jgi:2-keto-4-pentenoate hydratase/2-oxohepta-3-ene-1,7-dioic acid hydratase in catechol pathway